MLSVCKLATIIHVCECCGYLVIICLGVAFYTEVGDITMCPEVAPRFNATSTSSATLSEGVSFSTTSGALVEISTSSVPIITRELGLNIYLDEEAHRFHVCYHDVHECHHSGV